MTESRKKILRQVLIILVATVVLVLLARAMAGVRFDEVLAALRGMSPTVVLSAVGLMVVSYCWLIGYDALSLRYLRKHIPWPRLIFTALSAFALQRNVGPAPLTGGAVRYRYYRACGVSGGQAALVAVLSGFSFVLGIVFTAGLALLLQPDGLSRAIGLSPVLFQAAGAALLLGLVLYLYWSRRRQLPIRVRRWEGPPPSIRISLAQLLFGTVDVAVVAGVVYVLLPEAVAVNYPQFVGLYVLAMVVGALSHVPGGLGVFEAVLFVLLPGATSSELIASLLAFRGVYYLLPLVFMGLVAGLYELAVKVVPSHGRVRGC